MNSSSPVSRRGFLQSAGLAAGAVAAGPPASRAAQASAGPAKFNVDAGGAIDVETGALRARFEKGFLTSLESKASGEKFIGGFDAKASDALQLVYSKGEAVDVGEQKFGKVETRKVSGRRAEFLFQNWDGDGLIAISVEPETGDILVEPSAYSSRPGVRSCRWLVKGLRRDLKLVAPFYQGSSLALDDALIRDSYWDWPRYWEAALAIFQARSGGFWIHTQDAQYRYKALRIGSAGDPYMVGFDTEAYGPVDNNMAAGGLVWRIGAYEGDWKVPAARYRDWLWTAYGLAKDERLRNPAIHDLAMAISWCPLDMGLLDALEQRVNPKKVLIHFHNWRTDSYDENYPTYVASDKAAQFLTRAEKSGFHIMPHFNTIETDPNHAVYNAVRDFQYRDIETKKLYGWSWVNQRAIGVPESNVSRLNHRNEKVMVKIHPGLSMWRSILCGRILEAAEKLALRNVFVDVALNTHNLHNCLVENMTSTEGMNRLLRQIGATGPGLGVGAEGLNEITFQGLSFAQVHLFKSWHSSVEGLERAGGCALNNFLFGKLCRSFGYSGLGGRNENEELRARIHEEHEALPTITVQSAKEIVNPTPAVKRALDRARS
ncbi:MAG: hypothetical protein KIT09_06270 [Bryobacteraceae bacterium]|nr:hypothetical protein [Bryobacteraceae bacterium]